MGREGARLFHANGWRVGAIDRNDDGLVSLANELGADRLWTRAVDVTEKSAFEDALADYCSGNAGGGLDMMWNNAGSLMFTTSSSSATYGMPRLAVYSATKHAVKGLTEALSVEWGRHGVRVADVLPGLIDTAILLNTPDRSDTRAMSMTHDELEARAPKRGMFRLMPASSVADAAWQAYHHPRRLHWYVPRSIRWIDRIKGLSPELMRRLIVKQLPKITGDL